MARQPMTVDQILSILRETPDRLSALTGDLAEEQLHAAPEPGEWSVTEIAAHLRSCADVWGQAIERIATTDQPTIRAVSPATWIKNTDYGGLAFASSLQAFREQRDQLLALLGRLPEQGWARSATVLGAADHWNSPCIHMRIASLVTSGPTGGSWRRRYGK
jgi:DinB superfamily